MSIIDRLLMPLSMVVLLYFVLPAQLPEVWNETDNLPRWLTPAEEFRKHEIGQGFEATPLDGMEFRSIAEFERMEGVIIRYPLGIPVNLVRSISQHAKVYTLVANQSRLDQAITQYTNNGVNLSQCEFIMAPTNSMWTRDYGPWYVATENHEIAIMDFIYNRPRPLDNSVPSIIADYIGIDYNAMPLIHCGGNFMSEGRGAAMSTDLVIEENGFQENMVRQLSLDYLGLHTYHITEDAQGEYIRHIDTWAKLLAKDKILIAQVPTSNPRYHIYEEIADYYSQQISAWGTAMQVYRVQTPQGQPYTNSLILNERVYVPITGSPWDEIAIETYREAMPGYEILGFAGSWVSTDALHCRIKEMADRQMIYMDHLPLNASVDYRDTFHLSTSIIPYSKAGILTDSTLLIYSLNELDFDSLHISRKNDQEYFFDLPVQWGDTSLYYYITTRDSSGKKENWPLVGQPGSRKVKIRYVPEVAMTPQSFYLTEADLINDHTFTLTNETPHSVTLDSITFPSGNIIEWKMVDISWDSPIKISAGEQLLLYFSYQEDSFLPEYSTHTDTLIVWVDGQNFIALIYYDNQPSTSTHTIASENSMHLYPNPFEQVVTLDINLDHSTNVTVKLNDLQAKNWGYLSVQFLESGSHQIGINLPKELPPGMYLFQVETDDAIINLKGVKSQ